ncbi:MAG TPA: hypothetical protein PK395_03150 [bacterium]|nr:hypothetical protein [bacterium]HQP97076.1 hypothetical protein [bacterium]
MNRTLCDIPIHERRRPFGAAGPGRNRHRADDGTDRIARLTRALRAYGQDIPGSLMPGPEDVCWID